MSNRTWMPLHIDDYIRDTDHLSATEHGAYLLLIMKYWRDGGLPADEGLVRRYAKLSVEQWAESRDVLAALFDDGWRHKRIDSELSKADEIIEKRRSAAKGRHDRSKSPAHAEQMQCITPSICSDTGVPPLTNNISEPSGSGAVAPIDPRQQLWSEGIAILKSITGKTDGAARQLIGRWCRDAGDDCAAILSKIQTAQRERIGDPAAWITAALKPRHRPPKPQSIGDMFREDAMRMGLIHEPDDDQARRLETGFGDGQGVGSGGSLIVAVSPDDRRPG